MRRGAIIAVGSELLLGGRAELNSLFVAERLADAGIEVRLKLTVGDDVAGIVDAVRLAATRAEVVVVTGGLGPTSDDRTREAVARATGRPLRRRAEALEGVRRRLAVWGRRPTPAQDRQALTPTGAVVLANPTGSAPGFALTWRRALILALPGVSCELERMWEEAVAPRLLAAGAPQKGQEEIAQRVLRTFGLPESELDRLLHDILPGGRPGGLPRGLNVRVGLLASPLGVDVVLTAVGGGAAARLLDRAARAARRKVGAALFGEGTDTMEQVVGRRLAARGLLLAVAESCTGGLIGHRLTQVAGSSAYLDRALVCYSNRAKAELLGVPEPLIRRHGAVSAEVAAAMARGVRVRSGVQVGLSVTGIVGPGGGTGTKPVGLVYVGLDAADSDRRVGRRAHREVREFRFHGEREAIKLKASQAALNLLRLWLDQSTLFPGGRRQGEGA